MAVFVDATDDGIIDVILGEVAIDDAFEGAEVVTKMVKGLQR